MIDLDDILIDVLLNKDDERLTVNTGFDNLDAIFSGFKAGGAYLFAGLEKSGKTSFLLNIINWNIRVGAKVGFLSTEMRFREVVGRLKTIRGVGNEITLKKEFADNIRQNFIYGGVDNNKLNNKKGELDFQVLKRTIREMAKQSRFIIVDNLTTFMVYTGGRRGWEVLSNAILDLVKLAVELDIVILFVIHIKPQIVFNETPKGITEMIKNKEPEKIFRESVTFVRKPTLSDIYGGGGALSQIAGALLLWRPYQKFNDKNLREMSMVIVDANRYGSSGQAATFKYLEDSGRFEIWKDASIMEDEEMTNIFTGGQNGKSS